MSGQRWSWKVSSELSPAGPRHGDPSARQASRAAVTLTYEQSAALHALEHRQHHAKSLARVYDLALAAVRHRYPTACALLVAVDAERLSAHADHLTDHAAASRRVSRQLHAAPLTLGPGDRDAIEEDGDPRAPDPLEGLLQRRLRLARPVVGRIRLDGAVIALLILDQHPLRTPTLADRQLVQQMAELTTAAIARLLRAFFADLGPDLGQPDARPAGHRPSNAALV